MNRLRCVLFAAILVISSATLALGGEMQTPVKTDLPPPPPASASTPYSITQSTPADELQIVLQDATETLLQLLLSIY